MERWRLLLKKAYGFSNEQLLEEYRQAEQEEKQKRVESSMETEFGSFDTLIEKLIRSGKGSGYESRS